MNALWESFLGADYRPVALTAGSRALVRVVDDLGWLSDRITDDTGALLGDMKHPRCGAARLGGGAAASRDADRRAARGADLDAALAELRSIAQGRYREDITEMLGEPDDAAAVAVGRKLLRPPHLLGHCRGHRPHHPQRGPGGRPSGVGARARPPAAEDRHGRLGHAGDVGRRGHHQGLPGHQGRRAAQQPAHRSRAGARRRRHPCVPVCSTASGSCSARCPCCAAAR